MRPQLDSALSDADIAALTEKDKNTGQLVFLERQCTHCGGVHDRACPRVKRMRFSSSGQLLEVEFWESWDDSLVIYPDMLGVLEADGA